MWRCCIKSGNMMQAFLLYVCYSAIWWEQKIAVTAGRFKELMQIEHGEMRALVEMYGAHDDSRYVMLKKDP
jgi:hypothetical protein